MLNSIKKLAVFSLCVVFIDIRSTLIVLNMSQLSSYRSVNFGLQFLPVLLPRIPAIPSIYLNLEVTNQDVSFLSTYFRLEIELV